MLKISKHSDNTQTTFRQHSFFGDINTGEEFTGFFDEESNGMTSNAENLEQQEIDPDYYRPSLKAQNLKDGKYESRGRFVKNPRPGQTDVYKVYSYYLPNPDGRGSYYVTCTSNEGGKKPNIISESFFALKDHPVARLRNVAKSHFSRKIFFYTLFQILEDRQQPESVGHIKIFRYGDGVDKLIDKEQKAGVNVNSPRIGVDLNLVISEKQYDNGKGTTYENSFFSRKQEPMSIDGKKPVNWDTEKMQLAIYVRDNSPNLQEKVSHIPWTQDIERKVIRTVRGLIDDDQVFAKIYKNLYKTDYNFAEEGEKATFSDNNENNNKPEESIQSNSNFVSIDELPTIDEKPDLLTEKMKEVSVGILESNEREMSLTEEINFDDI